MASSSAQQERDRQIVSYDDLFWPREEEEEDEEAWLSIMSISYGKVLWNNCILEKLVHRKINQHLNSVIDEKQNGITYSLVEKFVINNNLSVRLH